uniref:5' exonuclease Apollo isoform X2 n=1 Tax=Erigeron canadensis TaxID=72917 RepID=UPI001CB9D4A4|nr:5' exonuclease Apollo isoform X2 [Erigeron canadensis]
MLAISGAVMFLFEGTFGNILHTGDCRLTPECLQKLPEKYIGTTSKEPKCRLDYVFLDCTFGAFSSKLPSKHDAVRQVIDCIWKHPDARAVYLTCDLLGQEEILVSVSDTFGSKIYIDKENNPECFQSLSLTVPSILSQDPTSRFHIFDGFPRITERAERKLAQARANFQPEPLIIRPSTQWYVFEDVSLDSEKLKKSRFKEAMRDKSGIWHVCYSMHSSRDELEWALRLLAPRWVVSTTPEFRAMDLSYVKRHCSYRNLSMDDPLWKLLDIDLGSPLVIEDLQEDISISRSQLDSSQAFVNKEEILTVPSEVKVSTVTLFGRARLGLHNSTITYEDLVKPKTTFQKENVEVQKKHEMGMDRAVSEDQLADSQSKSKELMVKVVKRTTACSPTRSSNGVGENIRKLYRSMHIPVPRPLPSLVALLNDRKKRARTRV